MHEIMTDARDVCKWSGFNSKKMLQASLVIFRYRLLDVLVNVVDIPHHPHLPQVSAIPYNNMPQRLNEVSIIILVWCFTYHCRKQIQKTLSDWSSPICKFEASLTRQSHSHTQPVATSGRHMQQLRSATLAESVSSEEKVLEERIFLNGLASLVRARHYVSAANYNKSLLNIELVCFALCWFGMVGGSNS